ncbi:LicD family protein [Pseudomonas citronellolis]|uniref:LicD family protein n=1 Tax=Pseudomonas citronellolis TaxID=53408 RepID=UPI00078BFEF1|nr:LicD family protein [Pseudomonas citronellolis]AMO78185.1 LicD family protein [Pseudomonas citronellolis]WRT80325.1 LicD family protein [Pseudomonas citronellolis]
MSATTQKEIQAKILEILKAVHALCEKHELKYFMLGGTLIGAVRHQGFIPWDDDIDIGIPRIDYEKFIKVSCELPKPFILSHPDNDPEYVYPYAKCYDSSTTVTEDFALPFTRGVWIDIFPIDNTFKNSLLQNIHFYASRVVRLLITHKTRAYRAKSIKNRIIRDTLSIVCQPLPRKFLFNILNYILKIKERSNSSFCGNFLGRWGTREIARSVVFNGRAEFLFSSNSFFGPVLYDEYLKKIYKNYMQLPPIEKQISDHSTLNIDLNKSYQRSN